MFKKKKKVHNTNVDLHTSGISKNKNNITDNHMNNIVITVNTVWQRHSTDFAATTYVAQVVWM